jgi:fructose transport system permease protein
MSDASADARRPQEFEKVLSGSDTSVASFDTHTRSPIEKIQHFLHSNPAAVPLIVLVTSVALFGLIIGGKFFSAFSMTLILQQVAITGIIGAAQTLVILTAGIDLSVGAIMVLSSVVMGQFTFRYGLPPSLAILCGFAVGALCGWINGVLVSYMKLPPFIVTLGTWQIVLATNFLYSANETIRAQDIEAQAPILQFFGANFRLGNAVFTYGVVAMVLMIGGDRPLVHPESHRLGSACLCHRRRSRGGQLSGVRVNRVLISVYVISGLVCALGRWDAHRPHRLGVADGRPVRQPRIHHCRGDRRHLAVRRTRLDPRHAVRRADRRRVPTGPAPHRALIRNGPIC